MENHLQFLKDALSYVHWKENAFIYDEIIESEFIKEYILIEFSVFNAMVIYDITLTNDVEDSEYSDQHRIYLVSEVVDSVVEFKREKEQEEG